MIKSSECKTTNDEQEVSLWWQLGDHMFYFESNILVYVLIFLEIVFRWWSINLYITALVLMILVLRIQRVAMLDQPHVPLVR